MTAQQRNHSGLLGFLNQSGERLEHRQVGFTRTVLFEALAVGDEGTRVVSDALQECFYKSCFSDPGLAGDKDCLPFACYCTLQPFSEPGHRLLAADQAAVWARDFRR